MPPTGTQLPRPALVRRDRARDGGVLVVVGGDEVPDWVASWCARSGREIRRQPVPRATPDRVRAIEMIAVAARVGGALLTLPCSAPARPGPPRVVAAVRDLPDDAQAVADAAATAAQMGADLVVAHGVPLSFGERSVGLDSALDRSWSGLSACAGRPAS